jgi:hypothetical protein
MLSGWQGPNVSPSDVLVKLEHARLAERAGDRRTALAEYRFVVDAWAHGDATVQPLVAESRSAIRRLDAEVR